MKKILLGTSALIGAAGFFAGAALAEAPKITVGGFADFQAGFISEDLDANRRGRGFRNDTEINFNIDGKSDNGLGYGAVIDLEADVTGDTDNQGLNSSRTYVYLEGGWGRVEMGSNTGAEGTLKVDASNIARATGGIDGDFTYFVNRAFGSTVISPRFLITPDLPLAYGNGALGDESTDNVNKITYYSPRWSGFQFGASYAPDSVDRGQTVTQADNSAGQSEDNISVGLNYQGQWDQIGFAGAVTGSWGEAENAPTICGFVSCTTPTEDLRAWNIGGKLSYLGWSFAASYGDLDDSLNTKNSEADYYTLGAAYEWGVFGASLTWLDSEVEVPGLADNEFDNLSLGIDYKLAEGLTPYAEVSFFDFDAPGTVNDNDGTVFIVGTELAF